MEDLIKRLEEATEGSRELDYAICDALGIDNPRDMQQEHYAKQNTRFTTSLDAALTLVSEGMEWLVRDDNGSRGRGFANTFRSGERPNEGAKCWPAYAATPPLALCIAALRARSQEGG